MNYQTRTQRRVATIPPMPLILATWLALSCGWWALFRGVQYTVLGLNYPAPLDGQEGMALWEAALLLTGQGLYVPVVPDRFVSAPYPPVHPFLLALFGHSVTPHVFWAGRMVSVGAAVVVAVAGVGLARQVTASKLAGLAAAVLILSFAPVQLWALRIKPDMVGLAFTVLGLWLVARWRPQEQPRTPQFRAALSFRLPLPLTLAAIMFVLAHFTKQTMLAGPLAAGTYLLLRDRWLAVRWGLFYLVLLGVIWAALDLVTQGQYTYHVWVLHKLQWYAARFWKLASQLRDAWPLALLSIGGVIASWRRPTVINAYVMWAPASLIGAGVIGSHHNHLLETGTALALGGAQAIGLGLRMGGRLHLVASVLVATQLLLWQTPLEWFRGDFEPDSDYKRYTELIQRTPGEVMADDIGLLYAAQRPIPYDDPAAMGPAATLGLWDQSQFVADIRAQRFSLIILAYDLFDPETFPNGELIDPTGRWTPEMLQAVKDAYELKFKDTQFIYVPRTAGPTR